MIECGFVAEAKRNLLEYAERMQKSGKLEEAFRALKEFADLSPENEEIRLMLAEQLKAAARTDEAREQLAKLYAEVEAAGDARRTRATLERMKAIDPEYDVEAAPKPKIKPKSKTSDLIFLDLSDEPAPETVEEPPATPAAVVEPVVPAPTLPAEALVVEPTSFEEPPAEVAAATDDYLEDAGEVQALEIEPTSFEEETEAARELPVERASQDYLSIDESEVEMLEGLDVEVEFEPPSAAEVEGVEIEPTAMQAPEPELAETEPAELHEDEAVTAVEPPAEVAGVSTTEFLELAEEELAVADLEFEVPAPAEREEAEIPGPVEPAEPEFDVLEEVEEEFVIEVEDRKNLQLSEPEETLDVEIVTEGAIWDETEVGALEVPELDLGGFGLEEAPSGELVIEAPDAAEEIAAVPEASREAPMELLPESEAPVGEEVVPEAVEVEPEEGSVELLPVLEAPADAEEVAELDVAPPDIDTLETQVADDPDNADLHRSLAEALIESGDRQRGLEELDIALRMHESSEDWARADGVVVEILRLDPNSVRHHQKRVELAFLRSHKGALAEAYLGLADALFRSGAAERARAVYQRVLEHDPDNEQAQIGLQTLEPAEPEAEMVPVAVGREVEQTPPKGDFVDLGALILEEDEEIVRDTRMRIEEEEPTGDEERDFQEMLSQFKRGIEANLADEDWQAHYDLGVAFKEMGLVDEAISEFQKALRSPQGRLQTAEALGTCFFEKGQYSVGSTVLRRAVDSDLGTDEAKVGLLYWLGRCEEEQGRRSEAIMHYQRVFAVDIGFQDVGERVKGLAGTGN